MLNKNENLNFTAWASFEEVIGQMDLQQSFERLRSASAERNGLIRRINSFGSDSFYNKAVGWKLPEDRKFNWLVEQYEDQVQIEFKLEWEVQQLFEQEYDSIIEIKPVWLQKHLSDGRDSWAKSLSSEENIDLNQHSNRHLVQDGFELNEPMQCENCSESDSGDRRSEFAEENNDELFKWNVVDVEEIKQSNSVNESIQQSDGESSHQDNNLNGNSVSTSNDNAGSPLSMAKENQTPLCEDISCESFTRTVEWNQIENNIGRMKKRIIKSNRKNNEEKRTTLRKYNPKPEGSWVRKRTKLRSSGESSSVHAIDLSKRRDVVNKTILRVLRRYLTQEFKTLVPQQYEDKEEIFEKFYENVKLYADKIFGESNPDIKILHFYLASVIDHRNIKEKDILESEMVSRDLTIFYDCLYKYSHTRLVNLFGVKPLGVIFEYFYNSAKDNVLKNEGACAKNKALYSKVLEEFLFIFQGKIDIATLID